MFASAMDFIHHCKENGIEDDCEAYEYEMAVDTVSVIREALHKMDVDDILEAVYDFRSEMLYGDPNEECENMTDLEFN